MANYYQLVSVHEGMVIFLMNKQTLVTNCPIRTSVRKGSLQFANLQHSGGKKKQSFITVAQNLVHCIDERELQLGSRLTCLGRVSQTRAGKASGYNIGLCQLSITSPQPLPAIPYPNKLAWQAKGTLWVALIIKKSQFIPGCFSLRGYPVLIYTSLNVAEAFSQHSAMCPSNSALMIMNDYQVNQEGILAFQQLVEAD